MIEDLDAIEPAPLESQRTPTRLCSCEEVDVTSRHERGFLWRFRSTDVRWGISSFLSPDDAILDLRRRTSETTEFRWELHTSSTDLDLARKTKCSCHSLIPEVKKPEGAQRGDLRKHHSAETDKWAENLLMPIHDLRKHSSDDTRFAREAKLGVPDVMPNPKPRCTCPKVKTPAPASPMEQKMPAAEPEKPVQKEEKRLYYSKSLAPDESIVPWEKPEMKRQVSEDPRAARKEKRERPKLERSAQVRSESSRRWGFKDKDKDKDKDKEKEKEKEKEKVISPTESKKQIRSRWAMKPHVSLPAEKKVSKWYRSQDETKSKSLRERPKYSIRRSMSPEPDPRQINKLENRIVRRLISPEISITSTKWAPYEDSSPLPTIGIRKREPKPISEIKWTPYDESPSDIPIEVIDDKKWSPFHNVTPPDCPPEAATPSKSDDEEFRWRILNQVAPFPLYQGGWKDESPEKTPPPKVTTPDDLSPPVWSPRVPGSTPIGKRKSIAQPQDQSPEYSPTARRPSKPRLTRKGAFRAKSSVPSTNPLEDRLPQAGPPPPKAAPPPPAVVVRAASEDSKRQRPQLIRSKALLDVPHIDATKRSLSEEGPRVRPRERPKAPTRTRSEEVSKYDDPWLRSDSPEMREYVTTV
ncbi:cyclin-dependent kinase 5 activator [Lasius niger]|uniref:Cyclin-dependent kinase 5 activator n=1 Tax=Lasius niger TaxID=67767 RepID=A0A0J7KCC7_LASNI|nr:cyclin-dependent kinase 5 activator [Lasius niger]